MQKRIIYLAAAVLSCAGTVMCAEDSDTVLVPLQDASRPPVIHIHLMSGGISVRGEDRKDVAVESGSRHRDEPRESEPPRSDGMHRLEMPGANGLDIREENNIVTIKTDFTRHGGDLTIVVPRRASLQLKSMNGGDIKVENVEGEIEAENLNGGIRLKDVGGSVIANSMNGEVFAELRSVDPSKPMSFSTLNGTIDVRLPANVKANVSLKTDNGEILSDFEVKLDAGAKMPHLDGGRQSDGSFHVRLDKTLHGSINGGGPEYKFRSFNGQILIRKGK